MLVIHPRIHTLTPRCITPANPWGTVEAIQIEAGRVICAGPEHLVRKRRRPHEPELRPKAAALLPGLIDTHAHLTSLGLRPGALELSDETSPKAWADAVATRASELPPGTWITGRAWNQTVWTDKDKQTPGLTLTDEGFPTHALLTRAAPNHPVILYRVDQHAVWVNQEAMRLAGVWNTSITDPPGGRVVRTDSGELAGVFIDTASDLIEDAIPAPERAAVEGAIRTFGDRFLDRGLTCVHSALVRLSELDAYAQALLGPDPLPLRARGMVYAEPEALADWAASHLPTTDAQGRWRVGTLKMFADGALGSRGAWMLRPYEGYPDETGFPLATPQHITAVAQVAARHGWQMATHAIGSRAIRETARAYQRGAEAAGVPDAPRQLRWRIEHVQHPEPEEIQVMAQMGLCAPMQPIHATRDMRFAQQLLGKTRAARAYPWRAVMDAGVPVGFGSDYPIETLDPFVGLHAAVTRQDDAGLPAGGWHPEHAVSMLNAVRAYTCDGARLIPEDEGLLGHLGVGAAADWIAIDQDPATATPEAVRTTEVLWSVINGQTVRGNTG